MPIFFRRSLLVAFAFTAPLLGCVSPPAVPDRPRAGIERLAALIEAQGFDVVLPHEAAFTPGAILEVGGAPRAGGFVASGTDVFPGGARYERPWPMPSLSAWRHVGVGADEMSLFALFPGVDPRSLGAELRRSGIRGYQLSFDGAWLIELTKKSIEAEYSRIPERYRNYLKQGHPVVLEALYVDRINLSLLDTNGRVVRIGPRAARELLSMPSGLSERSDGSLAIEGPFVIGVKTRKLYLDPGASSAGR